MTEPRTALGKRLHELRARNVASGRRLLSWDDIDRELEKDSNEMTDPKDLRILYFPLTLTEKSYRDDMAKVSALYAMLMDGVWFTHIAIVVRSWPEVPDAARNQAVLRAMRVCEHFALPFIWGRWLWVGWPSDKLDAPMPEELSHYDPAYYAAAIANLKAEARSLGAADTFLDAEPYARSVQKGPLKSGLGCIDQVSIPHAIERAVSATGPVDFIYPCSSSNPNNYPWSVVGLGKNRMDSKTYKVKTADGKVPANPPDGVEHKVHVWGHWVGENALSPADVMAFDMQRVRERFPENIGQWVYADDLVGTLKAWHR